MMYFGLANNPLEACMQGRNGRAVLLVHVALFCAVAISKTVKLFVSYLNDMLPALHGLLFWMVRQKLFTEKPECLLLH